MCRFPDTPATITSLCLTSVWTLPSKLNTHFSTFRILLNEEKTVCMMYSGDLLMMALFKNKGLQQQLKMSRHFRASSTSLLVKKFYPSANKWRKILRVNIYTSIQRNLCCIAKKSRIHQTQKGSDLLPVMKNKWSHLKSDNDCKRKPCTVISLTEEANYNSQREQKELKILELVESKLWCVS